MDEALYEIPLLRRFVGVDLGRDFVPDETTILKFRRLLERHDLARAIFEEVQVVLREKGLLLAEGRMVDATLIHAPSSTKNRERKRDPEMSSTKKGNQWYFGMKAHVATDLQGVVEAVEVTAAKVPDHKALDALLTGEEPVVLADRGYDYPSCPRAPGRAGNPGRRGLAPHSRAEERSGGSEALQPECGPDPCLGRARLSGAEVPVRHPQDPLPEPNQERRPAHHALCPGQSLPAAASPAGCLRRTAPKIRPKGQNGRDLAHKIAEWAYFGQMRGEKSAFSCLIRSSLAPARYYCP